MITRASSALLALAAIACSTIAAAQEPIKVGYWTSGFSVGFGAVLEAGKFLESQGLKPEFIHFSDVNGPTKALITHSIDVAFGTSVNGAFALGAQGAPVEVVLVTQIAEATFVAKQGSPLKTLADLRGKKVGVSPAGSASYSIAAAILERNYGLKLTDFTAVPGNEGPLVQFLERGDIDAASLRAVTIASVPDLKLQPLGRVIDEWKRLTRSNSAPVLGAAVFHKAYAQAYPAGVVKFIRAMIEATAFGRRDPDKTAEILRRASNLDARDATSYAKLWDQIYTATMEPEDVANFKTMAEIFRASGTLEGSVPDSIYVTAPYEEAKHKP
jgi:ABC-type nitrate/sulfonate/bicarbonate transport system substrate-binding protein